MKDKTEQNRGKQKDQNLKIAGELFQKRDFRKDISVVLVEKI